MWESAVAICRQRHRARLPVSACTLCHIAIIIDPPATGLAGCGSDREGRDTQERDNASRYPDGHMATTIHHPLCLYGHVVQLINLAVDDALKPTRNLWTGLPALPTKACQARTAPPP